MKLPQPEQIDQCPVDPEIYGPGGTPARHSGLRPMGGRQCERVEAQAANPGPNNEWWVQLFASLCAQNFSKHLSFKRAYENQTDDAPLLAWRARAQPARIVRVVDLLCQGAGRTPGACTRTPAATCAASTTPSSNGKPRPRRRPTGSIDSQPLSWAFPKGAGQRRHRVAGRASQAGQRPREGMRHGRAFSLSYKCCPSFPSDRDADTTGAAKRQSRGPCTEAADVNSALAPGPRCYRSSLGALPPFGETPSDTAPFVSAPLAVPFPAKCAFRSVSV